MALFSKKTSYSTELLANYNHEIEVREHDISKIRGLDEEEITNACKYLKLPENYVHNVLDQIKYNPNMSDREIAETLFRKAITIGSPESGKTPTPGLLKCRLIKIHKISFIDGGVYGEIYKSHGKKYYDVMFSIESEDGCFSRGDIKSYLTQDELDKLLDDCIFYDVIKNKISFSSER